MTLRKALLAATVLALPMAAAQAQPVTGLYVGAGVGANFREDSSSNGVNFKMQDAGWVALGSVGWGFGNGLRAELEGNYRHNEVRQTRVTIPGVANFTQPGNNGYFQNYGVMANVLYDFNLGWPVVPYVGVGVGAGWTQLSSFRTRIGAGTFRVDDEEVQFAYQGIVGLSYNLSAFVPGLAATAEYRYYGTTSPDLSVTQVSGPRVIGAPTKISPDVNNHSILLGLRYNFGVAPPPPPVAQQPQPPAIARTYLVFFDWDRADLTDRARQIIAEAAANAPRVQTTRIEVAGHADRSGTPQYNQALSRRRADNVAAELVRRGIARNIIHIQAFGESRPLVPTADGVREPQNRRVEIVLR